MQPKPAATAATRLLAVALSLGIAGTAAVAADQPMYRCQQGDEVIFSQEPCGADARAIDVQYDAPSPAEADAAAQEAAAAETAAAAGVATVEHTQRIEGLEREIEDLKRERDAVVVDLAEERQQGTTDRADDTFRLQKRGEMREAIDDYNSRIEAREAELNQLLGQ